MLENKNLKQAYQILVPYILKLASGDLLSILKFYIGF